MDDQPWDTLLWILLAPSAPEGMKAEAREEVSARIGQDTEALTEIIVERLAIGKPLGLFDDWVPKRLATGDE